MLNHALALANDGAHVSLIGYDETPVDSEVAAHPRIQRLYLRAPRRASRTAGRGRFLWVSALSFGILHIRLFWRLLRMPRPDAILVQNPPSIPALPVAWLAARCRRSRFLVDWHNFGYAMLALRLGPEHMVVRLARRWERFFGRRADGHFCVSAAMRVLLQSTFGLREPQVLYDRPRTLQPPLTVAGKSAAAAPLLARAGLRELNGSALLICPTSWTADEDMDMLLEGLRLWDSSTPTGHRLMALITGRGPLREQFEQRVSGMRWLRLDLGTAFLDPADYRQLLRAAHIGVCMHRSSSGVDLPMKMMDLFGARTAVCALDYGACLEEQVESGRTCLTFRTSEELSQRLNELLCGFPQHPAVLEAMQRNIEESCNETWEQAWQRDAAPAFQRWLTRSRV